jgi:hypothetical protein
MARPPRAALRVLERWELGIGNWELISPCPERRFQAAKPCHPAAPRPTRGRIRLRSTRGASHDFPCGASWRPSHIALPAPRPVSPWCRPRCIRRALHLGIRRCDSLAYSRYSRSPRLGCRAHRSSRCNAGATPRAVGAEKCACGESADDARSGSGHPRAGAPSVGHPDGPYVGGESAPPRPGAPAAHFSD